MTPEEVPATVVPGAPPPGPLDLDAEPLRPSLPVRRAAFTAVLTLTALSVVLGIVFDFRIGAYTLVGALGVGAVARAVLPPYLCLGLLVRSRVQDVVTMILLGVALAVVAAVVPSR